MTPYNVASRVMCLRFIMSVHCWEGKRVRSDICFNEHKMNINHDTWHVHFFSRASTQRNLNLKSNNIKSAIKKKLVRVTDRRIQYGGRGNKGKGGKGEDEKKREKNVKDWKRRKLLSLPICSFFKFLSHLFLIFQLITYKLQHSSNPCSFFTY